VSGRAELTTERTALSEPGERRGEGEGSGVGVSVLLRQSHGFEGFRLAHVELLVDQQPTPVRKDPRDVPYILIEEMLR
jgi:hypothetical protein